MPTVFQRLKHITTIEAMPTVRTGKCCWECQRIDFQTAQPGYSEYTPGDDFSLKCQVGHWELDTFEDNAPMMGRLLKLAEKCPDYVQVIR